MIRGMRVVSHLLNTLVADTVLLWGGIRGRNYTLFPVKNNYFISDTLFPVKNNDLIEPSLRVRNNRITSRVRDFPSFISSTIVEAQLPV